MPLQSISMNKTKNSPNSTLCSHSLENWHKSAAWFLALLSSLCFTIFIFFIVLSTRGGPVGATELFSGPCGHAVNINRILQAVLALLAIGVSVSFDFFMRLVSAPTVDDLRKAHRQGRSLDIAVHSFRNVRRITRWRTLGWVILILLAIPIQLFFHSSTFICFSSTDFSVFLISEAFTMGQDVLYPGAAFAGWSVVQQDARLRSQFDQILPSLTSASHVWDRLELRDCLRTYGRDPEELQRHRNLLLVVETGPDADAKGWFGGYVWGYNRTPPHHGLSVDGYDNMLLNSLWSFSLSCKVDRDGNVDNRGSISCKLPYENHGDELGQIDRGPGFADQRTEEDAWTIYGPAGAWENFSMPSSYHSQTVKYCLSEPYSAPCKVYVSNLFLLITMFCVLLGCICSVLISRFCWDKETCQSLGDALQAFLKHGETFSQLRDNSPYAFIPGSATPPRIQWTPICTWTKTRMLWGRTVSKTVWLWTYVPIVAILFGGSAALISQSQTVKQVPIFSVGELNSRLI